MIKGEGGITKENNSKRNIGVFFLVMLNVALICTLRGLPMMAEEGFSLVFYYLVAAVVFLIPVSLVSAELATGWPPHGPGGIYIWVNEAFGHRWGFVAIWMQWIQNVIWFPTVLSFIAGTLAYLYDPALAQNKIYMIIVVLVAYWGGTLANFRGIKTSGMISTICVIAGVMLPGIVIVALGIIWLLKGGASQITFSTSALIPDFTKIDNIVFLAGAFLIFSGIEVSAVHANNVRDPKRDYPKAIFLSAAIAVVLLVLGSLAIAIVVPQKHLSLVAGVLEALRHILDTFKIGWMLPVMAVLIALGSVGELCAWIVGPSKGLYTTAEHGNLPPFLQKLNRNGVPTNILIVQGIIVTALSFVFLLMPTVNSSYWILSALCIVLYLIMYILMFAAAIHLRYSKPDVERAYTVPGGKLGMWLIGSIGIVGAIFALVISFFPPSQLKTGSPLFYEIFMITGTVLMCAVPLIIFRLRKPGWKEFYTARN
ncbi:amino acid permease [Candidatus Auribacterota bacterium]